MKVKILENDCRPKLEKTINNHLKKGWKIKGNLLKGDGSLIIMMYKN